MHGAAVRVREASVDARGVLFWCSDHAHRDYRTSLGDYSKLMCWVSPSARPGAFVISNEPAGAAAGAFGSGSDGLRAERKTATLHRLRFDPVFPDMLQRRAINT